MEPTDIHRINMIKRIKATKKQTQNSKREKRSERETIVRLAPASDWYAFAFVRFLLFLFFFRLCASVCKWILNTSACNECAARLAMKYIFFLFYNCSCTFSVRCFCCCSRDLICQCENGFPLFSVSFKFSFVFAVRNDARRESKSLLGKYAVRKMFVFFCVLFRHPSSPRSARARLRMWREANVHVLNVP